MLIALTMSLLVAGAVALAAQPPAGSEQAQREAEEAEKARGELVRSAAEPEHARKPSGFWTGTRPARSGAYRYRLLGVGAGVLAISIFFTVRFVRKQSRHEA